MRWSGPYMNEEEATRQSEAAMRALCRARRRAYPLPPGRHVGFPRIADVAIAYATHATAAREDRGGQFWCGITPEIEALPDSEERVSDGTRVRVARSGRDKPEEDFPGYGRRPVPRGPTRDSPRRDRNA